MTMYGKIPEEIPGHMVILFFSRLFYPHIGGVETHVEKISSELIQKGHSVIVVTEQHDKNIPLQEEYKKIHIQRIPLDLKKSKKYQIWLWLWRNKEILKNADIIHAHDVGFWYFPFVILYPFKKFYITFHGYETKFPIEKKAIIIRKISEMVSSGVVCIGDYITKWYGTRADCILYGGVDVNQKIKIKNKNSSSPLKILFIGRVEEDNGIAVYDKTLQLLQQNKIPFHFNALGDGELRKVFEKHGKVLGFVDNVEEYIPEADIVFASSYLSLLQAFAYRKKVIAVYTNPLKKDYLSLSPFAKWITISDNAEEIVNTIQEEDKESKEKAFEFACNNSWKSVADKYVLVWKK